MFSVGDRVVYPMHGAGVVEAIEEREVLGVTQPYYIMRLPLGDMKVMVPVSSEQQVGLRDVISSDAVAKVYEVLRGEATAPMSSNWNRRYRANMDKIKTGDIFEVAEVVRNLDLRDREKGLSTGERKMLENASQILISELQLAEDMDELQARAAINAALGG